MQDRRGDAPWSIRDLPPPSLTSLSGSMNWASAPSTTSFSRTFTWITPAEQGSFCGASPMRRSTATPRGSRTWWPRKSSGRNQGRSWERLPRPMARWRLYPSRASPSATGSISGQSPSKSSRRPGMLRTMSRTGWGIFFLPVRWGVSMCPSMTGFMSAPQPRRRSSTQSSGIPLRRRLLSTCRSSVWGITAAGRMRRPCSKGPGGNSTSGWTRWRDTSRQGSDPFEEAVLADLIANDPDMALAIAAERHPGPRAQLLLQQHPRNPGLPHEEVKKCESA